MATEATRLCMSSNYAMYCFFLLLVQAVRQVLEAVDSFVGRYLVLVATFYLAVKFLHFKVFPDFP